MDLVHMHTSLKGSIELEEHEKIIGFLINKAKDRFPSEDLLCYDAMLDWEVRQNKIFHELMAKQK